MKYQTKCGGQIIVPWGTQKHLKAHPDVLEVLEEAIGKVVLPTDGSFLKTAVDLGRVIGHSGGVGTAPVEFDEQCLFAQRIDRAGPSRVVLDAISPEVSIVSVLAFQAKDRGTGEIQVGKYILATSWIGGLGMMEPWDPNIEKSGQETFEECLRYWSTHALVYDEEVMGKPFTSSWKEVLENGSRGDS